MTQTRFVFVVGALAAVAVVAAAVAVLASTGGKGDVSASPAFQNPFGSAQGSFQQQSSGAPGISVTGQGIAEVEPDTVVLSLGVTVLRDTAAQARDDAAGAMNALIGSLQANGVAENDIQTTHFSINPQYDYRPTGTALLAGYRVTNSVSVKVRDIDSAADVIDGAVSAVGDPVQVNGISFMAEDQEQALSAAREQAMAAAQAKAAELAALAGVSLGAPVSIAEGSQGGFDPYFGRVFAADAAMMESTPIQTGQLDIIVDVQVTYTIQ